MKEFSCPKCGAHQKAVAKEVTHHCPSNHNLVTAFLPVKGVQNENNE